MKIYFWCYQYEWYVYIPKCSYTPDYSQIEPLKLFSSPEEKKTFLFNAANHYIRVPYIRPNPSKTPPSRLRTTTTEQDSSSLSPFPEIAQISSHVPSDLKASSLPNVQMEGATTELEVLTQKACNLLFDTNFGISFGLYCASGQNFRAAVGQLFHCERRPRFLRTGLSKRSSTNQTNQHGNDIYWGEREGEKDSGGR